MDITLGKDRLSFVAKPGMCFSPKGQQPVAAGSVHEDGRCLHHRVFSDRQVKL